MNRVYLKGNLARDPELRTTQTGKNVASFSLAVDRPYSRKNDTQASNQPTVDFLNCVAWSYHADFVQKYLQKGSSILVEGKLHTRSYQTKDGTKRNITEVVVDNIEFTGPKPGGGQNMGQPNYSQPAGGFGQQPQEEIPF